MYRLHGNVADTSASTMCSMHRVLVFEQGELYVISGDRKPYELPCGDLCRDVRLNEYENETPRDGIPG